MDLDSLIYLAPVAGFWAIYLFWFRGPPAHDVSLEDEDIGDLGDRPEIRAEKEKERYYADRKDPVKAWFHGIYALQYGMKTDPGYWSVERASEHMYSGWGFSDEQITLESLEWYLEEPVGPAYDMVRSIIVARTCVAAGWISPARGRELCERAQRRILELVNDWEELAREIAVGRLEVFGGKLPRGRKKRDQANLEFGRKHVFPRVPFRVELPPNQFETSQTNTW